jgi:hypothetical protein
MGQAFAHGLQVWDLHIIFAKDMSNFEGEILLLTSIRQHSHGVCMCKYSECSANKLSQFPSYLRQHNGAKQDPIRELCKTLRRSDMNCDGQTV